MSKTQHGTKPSIPASHLM